MSIRLIYPENRKFDKDIHSIDAADIKQLLPRPHIDQKYNISLILPMYNVAPYIIRCLESVFNQIDINIQVIIINDGSTDESLSIALNYLSNRESKNTIIIDQKNRGLSAVRNIGVSFAVSEYIAYLDTDDFMAPDAYTTSYNFAVKNDLDLVLFRSMIFNSFNLTFSEFYDAYTWDSILEGRPNLITTSLKTPELLMLEPNANTKLIRRTYFLDNELSFPVGLVFEDYPVHVKGILRTEKIGLLGSKFYMYRTNRPGKITDEKSIRRFDSLQIFDQTVNAFSDQTISPEQGMSILYSLLRLTYWCGTETVLSDRTKFFSQLSHKVSSIPNDWIDMFKIKFRNNLQLILLCALRKSEIKYLFKNSVGSRNIFRSAFILIQQRCYRAFFSQSYGCLKNKIKILQKFN
jgi:glycosyltransferase involved in cell wall biosynthesis